MCVCVCVCVYIKFLKPLSILEDLILYIKTGGKYSVFFFVVFFSN